jgi:hypothetical protein
VTAKSVPGVKFSRRRIAIGAAAAVAALVVGYLAGQVLIPPSHNTPAPASTAPQGATVAGTGGATGATGAVTPAVGATAPATGTTASGTGATGSSGGGQSAAAASNGPPDSHAPLIAFTDRTAGFRMSYPKGWTRLTSKDAGVRLLASGPDGASLLVRLATLGVKISGRTLDELEALTGKQLTAQKGVTIVAGPKLLSINNLPGYLYIYSYTDPTTHLKAAHSQITLFLGKRMYTLVYQTAQAATLVKLAPLFDQVTDTFHAN